MRNCIVASKTQPTLQQTEQPSDAVGPSCFIDKVGKNKAGRSVVWRCTRQNRDTDDDEASDGPGDGGFIDIRQKMVHEGVDEKSSDCICDVDEKLMPPFRNVILVEKRNHTDNELRTEKPSRCDQGNPSRDIDPSSDPGKKGNIILPGNNSNPMVPKRLAFRMVSQTRRGD
jgi:hypothetical protein